MPENTHTFFEETYTLANEKIYKCKEFKSTCRSFFNKLLANTRDGLIEKLEDFISDTNKHSAKSRASSNM